MLLFLKLCGASVSVYVRVPRADWPGQVLNGSSYPTIKNITHYKGTKQSLHHVISLCNIGAVWFMPSPATPNQGHANFLPKDSLAPFWPARGRKN
jgi:hypothetical protein